jgi:PAS domain S-box-containing protein
MEKNQGKMNQEDSRRLRALFEMASDGIITIGIDGIIESVNQAATKLFGYDRAEMIGQKINLLMGDHDRKHHDEYLDRYQRTRSPHIIGIGREVTGRCKDGKEFPLRLSVSEVRLDDKTIYTGILHDITEITQARQRVEQLNEDLENKVSERTAELRATERELRSLLNKEKELNELKSRFLSMASHEFKTPLSTVLSSAEIIEMYGKTEQQTQREKYVERIKNAVIQLTEVLNDFLSLSQLEQGEINYNPKLIDLQALLSTVVESSEGQLKEGQQVRFDLPAEPVRIHTDAKLLRHVLINLVSNGAKYSDEGMEIILSVTQDEKSITIGITDRGMGIPPEDYKHLFDRFFRARNVENIKGTGLGLNIVKQYVYLLQGQIKFTSTMGKGSTFTVILPTNNRE